MGCSSSNTAAKQMEEDEQRRKNIHQMTNVAYNGNFKTAYSTTMKMESIEYDPKDDEDYLNDLKDDDPYQNGEYGDSGWRQDESDERSTTESANAVQSAEEQAAARIQAGYRGYKTRKEVKSWKMEADEKKAPGDSEEQVQKAATTIQAGYKGYKVRKEIKKDGSDGDGSPSKSKPDGRQEVPDSEIVDIDLNDPEVEKAASKIQATFRGYKSRREPQ